MCSLHPSGRKEGETGTTGRGVATGMGVATGVGVATGEEVRMSDSTYTERERGRISFPIQISFNSILFKFCNQNNPHPPIYMYMYHMNLSE